MGSHKYGRSLDVQVVSNQPGDLTAGRGLPPRDQRPLPSRHPQGGESGAWEGGWDLVTATVRPLFGSKCLHKWRKHPPTRKVDTRGPQCLGVLTSWQGAEWPVLSNQVSLGVLGPAAFRASLAQPP